MIVDEGGLVVQFYFGVMFVFHSRFHSSAFYTHRYNTSTCIAFSLYSKTKYSKCKYYRTNIPGYYVTTTRTFSYCTHMKEIVETITLVVRLAGS